MLRTKLIALAAAAIVVLTIAVAASIYGLGRESTKAEITNQNQEAQNEADRASSNFSRCMDDGGVFNFATGQCQRH